MLNIGIIGIGGIAQKAYLPYMTQLTGIRWHLFTRNQTVLQHVGSLFNQPVLYDTLEDLQKAHLDGVFIHAATKVHFELALPFLQAGVPVYMDKPLTEDVVEIEQLYQAAANAGTFLMTGFNRRFAPQVRQLKTLAHKTKIVVEKNDVNRLGEKQFKLFDFFIHPLDTALYLLDERPIKGYYHYQLEDGQLRQVMVTLLTTRTVATAGMNLQSGARRETIEVQTPQETALIEDLSQLTFYRGQEATQALFGSWVPTLQKRGFETVIDAFLDAIQTGDNPVSPASSLLSHHICQQISQSATLSGELDLRLAEEIDGWS